MLDLWAAQVSGMDEVEVYGVGIVCASVCAPNSMSPEEVVNAVNAMPDMMVEDSELRWFLSEDETFASGQQNPCPCDRGGDRTHYLLNC